MNTEIFKYYKAGSPDRLQTIPITSETGIIAALDDVYGSEWEWEVADEQLYHMTRTGDDILVTTVHVYLPEKILTGRNAIKNPITNDFNINHLHAIVNACQSIFTKSTKATVQETSQQEVPQSIPEPPKQEPEPVQPSLEPKPLLGPAQEAMDALLGDPIPEPKSTPETSPVNQTTEELPIPQEIPFEQAIKEEEEKQASSEPDPLDLPQDKYMGFSQRQINRINAFKKNFAIENDLMFSNYLYAWSNNPDMTKKDLTPENVNKFLDWVENDLGK